MSDTTIANTPTPPYYAVIFTSTRTSIDGGYRQTAERMVELARAAPGFLGVESVREGELGITVSYWRDERSIAAWREQVEHRAAQERGKSIWYDDYFMRVAKVERAYRKA